MVDLESTTERAQEWNRELASFAPEVASMETEFKAAIIGLAGESDMLMGAHQTAILALQNFLERTRENGRVDREKLDKVVSGMNSSPIKGLVQATGLFILRAQETTVPAEMVWAKVVNAGNNALIQQMAAKGYN